MIYSPKHNATKITLLGTGPSMGVPHIGNVWGRCDPNNLKNHRMRTSLFVERQRTKILIDTSPDLRAQLLAYRIEHIDALLYTHAHADHLHGIDELRGLNMLMQKPIATYLDQETYAIIQERFPYVLTPLQGDYYYKPCLNPHFITANNTFSIDSLIILPLLQDHGHSRTSLGFKMGNFAYTTDLIGFAATSLPHLYDLDLWVIGCLQKQPHATHAHLDLVYEWYERFKPKQIVLTHMGVEMDYADLQKTLPSYIIPGYDGLILYL